MTEPYPFDPDDPFTWWADNMPEGYKWQEVGEPYEGEEHLFSPEGENLSMKYHNRMEHERRSRK